jgi:hypothetical protein
MAVLRAIAAGDEAQAAALSARLGALSTERMRAIELAESTSARAPMSGAR